MKTGTACNRAVAYIDGDESALEAAKLMRQHHVGDLVITREDRGRHLPVGVVTDRDLVLEVLAQGIDPDSVTVGDLFTSPTLITATIDDELEDTLRSMRSNGVRRVPVVEDDGALVGIITMDDMLGVMAGQLLDITRLIARQPDIETERRQA